METPTTKILLFNVGYCTELHGRIREYVTEFLRYFYTPRRILDDAFASLEALLLREKPELCFFLEARPNRKFLSHLRQFSVMDCENKYGLHSLLRRLPIFRRNCSSVLAKKPLPIEKHFLRHGTKKLLYEIVLQDDLSVFIAHFSLSRHVRRQQFAELEDLIRKRTRVILCGDFNVFSGPEELYHLLCQCNLRIVNRPDDFTFPTCKPRAALDLFLCSHDVRITDIRVLDTVTTSDHFPVILEVALHQ